MHSKFLIKYGFKKFETFKVAAYYNVDTLFVLGTFGN